MNDFYQSLAIGSQVVASVLFIVVLVYGWVRFVAPAVVASQERKNAELAESEVRRDQAKDEVEAAQRELLFADDDAKTIASRAANDAADLRRRLIEEARADGERVVRNAEGELDRGRAAARQQVRAELLDRAVAIARERARSLDDDVNGRLVGEAVDTAERGGRG